MIKAFFEKFKSFVFSSAVTRIVFLKRSSDLGSIDFLGRQFVPRISHPTLKTFDNSTFPWFSAHRIWNLGPFGSAKESPEQLPLVPAVSLA